ncbi:MAG: trypsin-like peptidase domain-containing protein [Planctomycetes bacterium]|nr:trypsin-like peptidase domain-containing protein [Planctomycetota bacterium]
MTRFVFRALARVRLLLAIAVPSGLAVAAIALGSAAAAPGPIDVEKSVLDAQAERIAAIKKVFPAVVAVCMQGGQGVGSGVIITPDGYALTNFHVVQPTGPLMQAGLADGVLYDAVLVGTDKVGDVSLIKLLPKEKDKPFPFVKLGDSDKVRIGDWSLAMGNPFSLAMDFTPTVTYGIISGTNRYQPPEGKGLLEYTDCIQIETSINPGNSGGPLFNMQGELIGINGRGSFEKRGRVNSGVGYAISINQIKNFLGHMRAGIDTDHATLGATVGTASEDALLTQMVIKQVLEGSDAERRGLKEGDQLSSFAGRNLSSTNQYKNILGIFPKEWRVPLTLRRNNERRETLVRLMGNIATEKEPVKKELDTPAPPTPKLPVVLPKGGGTDAAKLYIPKKGYANWYFNELERDKLLAEVKKQGDFSTANGAWVAEGQYTMGERKGDFRFEIAENKDADTFVNLKLNIEHKLAPLKDTDHRLQAEPIGSGGLMLALYHWNRFLTLGAKGFEGGFAHGGTEPLYPFPVDGSAPKSLVDLRTDCAVIKTKHGSTECKWYFSLKDNSLIGFETYTDKEKEDPCEVYFSDYKAVEGKQLPHRIEVRFKDKRYAMLTVNKYTLAKK